MRKILLLLLISSTTILTAQIEIDTVSGSISLDKVHKVKGSAIELKTKAFEWVAKSYNNSNYVTRLNNDSKIITKGSFLLDVAGYPDNTKTLEPIDYILELSFKKGRYRIEIKGIKSDELMFSLMTKDEFKDYWVNFYTNVSTHPAKKMAARRHAKDKFNNKMYGKMKLATNPIVTELRLRIKDIDQRILSALRSASSTKEDW